MEEVDIVLKTSEGDQGASSRTSRANIASDREVLKRTCRHQL